MIDALHGFGLGLVSAGWWTGFAWPVIWTLTNSQPPGWTGYSSRVNAAMLTEIAWPATNKKP